MASQSQSAPVGEDEWRSEDPREIRVMGDELDAKIEASEAEARLRAAKLAAVESSADLDGDEASDTVAMAEDNMTVASSSVDTSRTSNAVDPFAKTLIAIPPPPPRVLHERAASHGTQLTFHHHSQSTGSVEDSSQHDYMRQSSMASITSHSHDLPNSHSNDDLLTTTNIWSPSAARTPNQSALGPFPGTPADLQHHHSATEHARRTSVSDLLTDRVPLTPMIANGGATLMTPSSAAAATVTDDRSDKGSDYNLLFGAVEARWILTVLDDCVKKLDTVSWLHTDLLKDKAAMAIADPVAYETIKDHFRVEKQFEALLASGNVEEKELKEMDDCFADSTREVLRVIRAKPSLGRRLKDVYKGERSPATNQFILVMARLRRLIHNKLRMTAEEEKKEREQLAELKQKIDDDNARFKELSDHLRDKKEQNKKTLEQKDKKIISLRKKIEEVRKDDDDRRKRFRDEMERQEVLARRDHLETESRLLTEYKALLEALEKEGTENFRTEHSYHRKKWLKAQEVENMITVYDKDMTDKHEALVRLQAEYKAESAELARLDEYFKKVDAENKRIEQELKDLQERRTGILDAERKRHEAAVLVQKLFRGYNVRLAILEKRRKIQERKEEAEAKKNGPFATAMLLAAKKKKEQQKLNGGAATVRGGAAAGKPGQRGGMFSRTAPGSRRGQKQEEVPIRTKMSAIQKILAKG